MHDKCIQPSLDSNQLVANTIASSGIASSGIESNQHVASLIDSLTIKTDVSSPRTPVDDESTDKIKTLSSNGSLITVTTQSPECVSSKDMEMDDECWSRVEKESSNSVDPFQIAVACAS